MNKRGRPKGRSTTLARIDTAVLIYLRRMFGNINKKLIETFPDSIEFVPADTDSNQLELFRKELKETNQ